MCLGNVCVEKGGDEAGERSAIAPDLRTFNLVLATLASAGKWEKALQVSAPLRIPRGNRSSGRKSGSGGRRGGGRGAVSDALKVAASELQADGDTYTHLIIACGKGGEPDRCGGGGRQGVAPVFFAWCIMRRSYAMRWSLTSCHAM